MRRGLLAFLAIACLLASAVDFQDSPEKASIHVAGHVFAINKKTSPSWGGSYIFSIDNEKSLRLGFYAGVEDEIFPNGKMQLLASRAPVKVQIAERTEHTLTVRAEYGLAPLDSPAKNSDYDALRMVYYLAFADNIPGIVVRARLIGQNRSVTVVNFNGSFGSDFVRYTTTSGETIDYPEKSWSGIKGEYVIAERHDGTRMVITASTRLPARGFSWHGPANQWHKITLQPDEILDKLGIIGFVTDDAAIERLKSFQQSLPVPKEQTQVDSTTAMTAVPAQYLKDGFPETWPAPMVIRQGTGWVRPDTTDTWKSDNDLSFTATAAFDSDFLYIRADVTDNVFFQDRSNGSIWAGDCIQLAFDPLSEKSLSNNYILLGVTATDTPIVWCWNHPDEQFRNTELTAQCRIRASRHATGQVYEVAIPWNLLNPFTMDRGKMGFNLVILDNDGYGVKHWMGITDGIAGGKDPSFYQPLHFQNPEKLALAGMKAGIPLLRLNTDVAVGDFPMDFTVAVMISETMVEPELIVNAGKRQFRNKVNKGFNALKFRLEPADLPSGALTIAATATAEGKAINTTEEKILVVTHDSLETRCQETLTATEKLKEAIRDLEKAGKNTSYFTNRTALAEYFVRMVRLDNDRKVINRQPKVGAKYQMIPVTQEYRRFICRRSIRNLDYCIQMLQDGMAEAYEIIQGKRPDRVVAPMPKKANVTIKDGGFQLDGREMFFLGPNTWSFHYTQLTDIAGAGMNFFDITGLNRNNSTNDLTPRVEEFNPNQFSALFNPNSIITAGELGLYFFGRQMAGSNYVDDLNKPDDLKKQTAANQVVWKFLASQPHMAYLVGHAESFAKDTKIPRFEKNVQEHLRKTFGTVEKMNATLGTTYHDFTDFRDGDRNGNPALRYEVFRMEQDWNLATLHKSSADRRAFWQKPLSSHMTTSHWTAWDILLDSADYEGIWKELDVIGYDAGVRYGSRRYAASWEAVLMMCDFARSVFPDKPIANNETHNFPINCSSDISGDFIYNAQMAEMLHGRNAGVMWKWEQDFHSPWGSYAFTRANCFHAASLAALDARRLASEIATFRSEPRQFALFYSIPSFSDPGYYIRLSNVYQGAFFHGMTPGFITERQLADTEWQTNCKLILVPDARRVSNASFQALERLMRSGVTVIRVGEQALAMDEYGRICPQRAATLSEMTTLPLQEPEQYFTAFGDIFQKQGLHGTRQVTSPDGKPLWALEYRASSDGRLLYVINWDKRKQEIKLPEGDWHELISDTPSPTTRIIAPLEVRIFKARR